MDFFRKNKWTFFVVITFILLALVITPKEMQNDTFSAIKVGERILNEGFPKYDNFSVHEGLTFTYPHWLFDVIVYSIFSIAGFVGLHVFLIATVLLLMLLIYFVCNKLCKNSVIAFLITLVSFVLFKQGLAVRAQVISYILFILQVYSIERLLETGFKRYIVYLVLISFGIVNFHVVVWPLYFIFYLPYLVNFIPIRVGKVEYEKSDKLKLLLIPILISLLLGFVSPLKFEAYTYSIKSLTSDVMMTNINEHQSPSFANPSGIKVFAIVLVILTLLIVIKNKLKLSEFCFLVGLITMSFISIRHVWLLLAISPLFLSRIIVNVINEYNFSLSTDMFFKPIPVVIYLLVMSNIILFFFPAVMFEEQYVNSELYPISVVNHIKSSLDTGNLRMYNGYNYGSYLLFSGLKPFFDSRCDLYIDTYSKGTTVAKDGFETLRVQNNYREIFKKYNLNYALLNRDSNLNRAVQNDDYFKVVYGDNNFCLYKVSL